MENIEWLDIKTTYGIHKTSYYLIDDRFGACYEYIERQNIWGYKKIGHVKCGLSG